MEEKYKITLLYDAIEDKEKAKAEPKKEAFPLVYEQVTQALEKRGHTVKVLAAKKNIKTLVGQLDDDESDIFFNLCESIDGAGTHEQRVASLLELMGKPFTGSGSAGMALPRTKDCPRKSSSFTTSAIPVFAPSKPATWNGPTICPFRSSLSRSTKMPRSASTKAQWFTT